MAGFDGEMVEGRGSPATPDRPSLFGAAVWPASAARRGAGAISVKAKEGLAYLRRVGGRMGPRDWQRRYFTLLSLFHRQLFDRSIEQLLFSATPKREPSSVLAPLDGNRKLFIYRGPISRMVFYWAMSALPPDLKRYAFVDFDAGNGRTLLLAARLNFEHASGYAFDAESRDVLEMNIAQYSRSYMSCRDVRALQGGCTEIAIPAQPAVLFFPDSLADSRLHSLLQEVITQQRRNPQPLFLVFENSGREAVLDEELLFERVSLPLLNRIKAFLFSPAAVAVYRSIGGNEA